VKIAILPTGRTECAGLPAALQRLFPGNTFYAVAIPEDEESSRPYDGFTSFELTEVHETTPPEAARLLVEAAAQEALGDRRREAADLVIVLDDLELANAGQPERVTRVFRRAVECHLEELRHQGKIRAKTEDILRARVSFHLVVPMIEAWFFADRSALTVAGVPPQAAVVVEPDLEMFCTNHLAYLGATEKDCPCLPSRPDQNKKYRPKWLGTLSRERHPKGYLQWLCIDGAAKNCTRYSESVSGGDALKGLRWEALLTRPGSPFRYLRALLADISGALGQAPIVRVEEDSDRLGTFDQAPARPRDHVLRNL
jgi:hypothetical protein